MEPRVINLLLNSIILGQVIGEMFNTFKSTLQVTKEQNTQYEYNQIKSQRNKITFFPVKKMNKCYLQSYRYLENKSIPEWVCAYALISEFTYSYVKVNINYADTSFSTPFCVLRTSTLTLTTLTFSPSQGTMHY